MAYQNINQYNFRRWGIKPVNEITDICLASDERDYDQEVVFLMIDADSDFVKAQNYLNRKNFKFKVYTFASDIPKSIFSGSLPTTIVFDKKGRIAMNGVGPANYASKEFLTFIQKLKDLKE